MLCWQKAILLECGGFVLSSCTAETKVKFQIPWNWMSQIRFPCVCRYEAYINNPMGDKAAGHLVVHCCRCISGSW